MANYNTKILFLRAGTKSPSRCLEGVITSKDQRGKETRITFSPDLKRQFWRCWQVMWKFFIAFLNFHNNLMRILSQSQSPKSSV